MCRRLLQASDSALRLTMFPGPGAQKGGLCMLTKLSTFVAFS